MHARFAPIVVLAAGLAVTGSAVAQTASTIAEAQRGALVTLKGTVERITDDDEFRLTDHTGSLTVYIGPTPVPVGVGERISVTGRMDDGLIRELYARSLTRQNGTTVTFEHRYD